MIPSKLAYLHMIEHSSMGAPPLPEGLSQTLRSLFDGTFILSGGYDKGRAEADITEGKGDLVAFGRSFISNPKLVERLKADLPLTDPNFDTLYTPGEEGYIDYPS
jgi:N-ethylmaleimide reductase